jgi:hypothetical protein
VVQVVAVERKPQQVEQRLQLDKATQVTRSKALTPQAIQLVAVVVLEHKVWQVIILLVVTVEQV